MHEREQVIERRLAERHLAGVAERMRNGVCGAWTWCVVEKKSR